MQNRFIASITLASFLTLGFPALAESAPGPAKQTPGVRASVEAKSGKVLLLGDAERPSGELPSTLEPGSTVSTGDDGEAIIVMPDGNRVRVSANTEFTLTEAGESGTKIDLRLGKLLGSAQHNFEIRTPTSALTASRGEFVLETTVDGAGVKVLSGDARLEALDSGDAEYPALAEMPDGIDTDPFLGLFGFEHEQNVGKFVFGAPGKGKGKGKGKGIRVRTEGPSESVGGLNDASPDQDIINPGPAPEPAVVVETPPSTVVPEGGPAAVPPTTPPFIPVVAAVAGGIGGLGIAGGALALGGIAYAVTSNDSDNENNIEVVPNLIPSPSLP